MAMQNGFKATACGCIRKMWQATEADQPVKEHLEANVLLDS